MISFFFFNDTATTEIYTLSLHDALPISSQPGERKPMRGDDLQQAGMFSYLSPEQRVPQNHPLRAIRKIDRKSTRLNSSHSQISYAVFCLKKKKKLPHCIISARDTQRSSR